MKEVLGIAVCLMCIGALACWMIANVYYRTFLKQIAIEDAENGQDIEHEPAGQWTMDLKYIFRPPVPIVREARQENIQKTIRTHNNLVKMYWLFVALTVMDVLWLMLMR